MLDVDSHRYLPARLDEAGVGDAVGSLVCGVVELPQLEDVESVE